MKADSVQTVDDIVADVEAQLDTPRSRHRMDELDGMVASVLTRRAAFESWHQRVREREGTRFYVSFSKTKGANPRLSVRTNGVQCGIIELADSPQFLVPASVSERLRSLRTSSHPPKMEWADKRVADYVKKAVASSHTWFDRRESAVEAALIELMRWRGQTGPKKVLRNYRPVMFCNLPFQLPSPVTPRGKGKGASGHIDVLARTDPGCLELFEVKSPTAADSAHALHQAVAYAAGLRVLMARESRSLYWKLFETERGARHLPTIGATAFVHNDFFPDLQNALEELGKGNRAKMPLKVMHYQWEPRGNSRRLVIQELPTRPAQR